VFEGAFGVVLVGELCERVFRGDVRVGVVGAGSDLGCGDDEKRGDTRLDTRAGDRIRPSGSPGGDGRMSPRPTGEVPTGRLELSKACKNAPWGERIECGTVLEEGCDCAGGKRPSCSRMRLFAGLKMERAREGDLERLEPVRGVGRLTSSENTGCRKRSGGSSTRTGRGILAHCLRSTNWPSVAQDAICHIMSRHLNVTPVLVLLMVITPLTSHSPRPPLA
jgi:hypothetical protein